MLYSICFVLSFRMDFGIAETGFARGSPPGTTTEVLRVGVSTAEIRFVSSRGHRRLWWEGEGSRRRRRWLWWTAVVAVVICTVLIVLFFLLEAGAQRLKPLSPSWKVTCSYLSLAGGRSQRADTSHPLHPLLFPFFSSSFFLVRVRQRRRCWAVVPGHPGRGHRPCLLLVLQEGGLRLAVFPRGGALLPHVPALQL
jgi:hypothetical protein